MKVLKIAGVILGMVLVGSCSGLTTAANGSVEIEGHVYANFLLPSNVFANPVAGAVVSTSLDLSTTTTDASGHFDLKSNSVPSTKCMKYTVTITAAGLPTYSHTDTWGTQALNQSFSLSPPVPILAFSVPGCP